MTDGQISERDFILKLTAERDRLCAERDKLWEFVKELTNAEHHVPPVPLWIELKARALTD
jgi:hypothetical protein